MDWFLYDNGLHHERVNTRSEIWRLSFSTMLSNFFNVKVLRLHALCFYVICCRKDFFRKKINSIGTLFEALKYALME